MAINRGQWGELLVAGASAVFVDDYNELPSEYPQFFDVKTSAKAFEDDLVATGLSLAGPRPEGEPIPFDRPYFRGKVRYIHAGFGLGYEITREAVDDQLYPVLNSQSAGNLARSHRETEEVVAANVFNFAFTTVHAYDDVSVFNTAHPGVGGQTIANRPSPDIDISTAALKAAMERYFALKTDRGIRISMSPETLVTGVGAYWAAQEVLGTRFVTGAAAGGETTSIVSDQVPNVVTSFGLRPVMWRYLTDADMWFLMAPKAQLKVKFYWRQAPEPVSGFQAREQISWFGIISRFSAGITKWQGLDGSVGA